MRQLKKIAKNIMKNFPKLSVPQFMKIENITNSTVNQAGRDIIINQGLIEQLHQSFRHFDFVKACGQTESIKRMMNISDDFEISFDTAKANVFKMQPKQSEGNPTGVVEVETILALPREYECFLNASDLMRFLFFKQKVLRAKTKSVKAFIGGKTIFEYEREIEDDVYLLEAKFITHYELEISVQKHLGDSFTDNVIIAPPRFAPPASYILETTKGMHGITLLLGIEEIDEDDDYIVCRLTNRDQSLPLRVDFNIRMRKWINKSTVPVDLNYNFVLEENAGKYFKVLVSRLFLAMKETKQLILRDASTGEVICRGEGIDLEEKDYIPFRFWGLIDDIENAFGVDLGLPVEISKQDWQSLQDLSEILKSGKKVCAFSDFTVTINDAKTIADIISANVRDNITFRGMRDEVVDLFGQKINVGEQLFYTPPLKLLKKRELKRELKLFRVRDELKVKFAPSFEGQEIIMIYPKFYGISDEQEIMKKENLPGRWVIH